MIWDLPAPHTLTMTVTAKDIDELGHANNASYVRWLERCAWQHSQSLGLGLDDYRALDRAMVVLRHEIDYLAAAYLHDELCVATWIVHSDQRLRLTRHFQIVRVSDQQTLLRAKSTFVCIELSTGKPRRMPPAFSSAYGGAVIHTAQV
ncbi:MAG: thioesterase family protein [Pseudomonadales bacterium]|nr:thioesterase family protein [Pseudomonadales bacterium]